MIFSNSLLQNFSGDRSVVRSDAKEIQPCSDPSRCELFPTFNDTILSTYRAIYHSTLSEESGATQNAFDFNGKIEIEREAKQAFFSDTVQHTQAPEKVQIPEERNDFGISIGAHGLELPSLSRLQRLVRIDQEQQNPDSREMLQEELDTDAKMDTAWASVSSLAHSFSFTGSHSEKKSDGVFDKAEKAPIDDATGLSGEGFTEPQINRFIHSHSDLPPDSEILFDGQERISFSTDSQGAVSEKNCVVETDSPLTSSLGIKDKTNAFGGVDVTGKKGLEERSGDSNAHLLNKTESTPNGKINEMMAHSGTSPADWIQEQEENPFPSESNASALSAPETDSKAVWERFVDPTRQTVALKNDVSSTGEITESRRTSPQPMGQVEANETVGVKPDFENRVTEARTVTPHQSTDSDSIVNFSLTEEANSSESTSALGKRLSNKEPDTLNSSFPDLHQKANTEDAKADVSVSAQVDKDLQSGQNNDFRPDASFSSPRSTPDRLEPNKRDVVEEKMVKAETSMSSKPLFSQGNTDAAASDRDLEKNSENEFRLKTVNGQIQNEKDKITTFEHRHGGSGVTKENGDGSRQTPVLGSATAITDESEKTMNNKKQPAADKNDALTPKAKENRTEAKSGSNTAGFGHREKQQDFTGQSNFKNLAPQKGKEEVSSIANQDGNVKKTAGLPSGSLNANTINENEGGKELPQASFTRFDNLAESRTFESVRETETLQHTAKEVAVDGLTKTANKSGGGETAAVTKPEQILPDNLKNSVLDQLVNKASMRSLQDRSECKIRLQPEFLGNVRMTVATQQEQVTIRIVTEHPSVKDSIESNLHLLKAELKNHGLTIDKFDVFTNADADLHSGRDQSYQTAKDHSSQNGRQQMNDQDSEKESRRGGNKDQEEKPRRDQRRQNDWKQNGVSHFA
jgi:flagellar hook-length control protein FliK